MQLSSDFSGLVEVTSLKSELVWKRRPGLVGLRERMAMISSVLEQRDLARPGVPHDRGVADVGHLLHHVQFAQTVDLLLLAQALQFLEQNEGIHVHNLGTGRGYSVLEMINAFEAASGQTIDYRVVERRPGDAAESYADPAKAERELGWKAELGIERMCEDVWRWQSYYPDGFESPET